MKKLVSVMLMMFSLVFGVSVFAKSAVKSEAVPAVKTENVAKSSEVNSGVKIGVIDLTKVLQDAPQLEKAKKDFKKKFEGREKGVQEAQKKFNAAIETFSKNSPTMKPDVQKAEQQKIIEQQKALQDMHNKLQDEINTAQNKVMKDIMSKVEDIVKKTAVEKQMDVILVKGSLAYNKKEFEITEEVIAKLKKQ